MGCIRHLGDEVMNSYDGNCFASGFEQIMQRFVRIFDKDVKYFIGERVGHSTLGEYVNCWVSILGKSSSEKYPIYNVCVEGVDEKEWAFKSGKLAAKRLIWSLFPSKESLFNVLASYLYCEGE